jgi:MFS family permease
LLKTGAERDLFDRDEGRRVREGRAAFRWLWTGQTASVFGTAVSGLAIPTIAIVALGAPPFAVGALAAVQFGAFPLLGLIAGVWVDRWPLRATMLVADIVRMLALASIPIAAIARVLSFAQLLAVAACVGIASVFFDVAHQTLLPSLVESDELERANARLQVTESAAQIAGNGFAGALIALLGAPLAVVVDAASFGVSVLTLSALRVPKTHRSENVTPRAPFLREVREGIDVVLQSPVLVRIAGATSTSNLGIAMAMAVGLLYMYRVLHLSPALVGLLLAVSNLGFAGALLAPRIARRFGAGPTMVWSLAIAVLSQFLIPLALWLPMLPALFVAELAMSACVPIYNITQVSLRQRTIPADRLGRANATLRTVVWGTLPLGNLLGGALGETIGIVPTLFTGTIVAACSIPWLLTAPVRALRAAPPSPAAGT